MVNPISSGAQKSLDSLAIKSRGAEKALKNELDSPKQGIEVQRPELLTAKEITKEQIAQEMETLNDVLVAADKNLRFRFHDETEQLYVELIDAKTLEVIKSLPPEYMLELSVKMKELIGLFVDERI